MLTLSATDPGFVINPSFHDAQLAGAEFSAEGLRLIFSGEAGQLFFPGYVLLWSDGTLFPTIVSHAFFWPSQDADGWGRELGEEGAESLKEAMATYCRGGGWAFVVLTNMGDPFAAFGNPETCPRWQIA